MKRFSNPLLLVAAVLLGVLTWPAPTALGQSYRPGHRKPPVAPTDGKPVKAAPAPRRIGVETLTYRLRHDRRLDGSHIRVTAYGHRVGLYGTVPNTYQRRIARQIAQSMMGVTYVADHLTVVSPPPSADALSESVRNALHLHPVTSGTPIKVQAHGNIVTLTATVPTLRVKQAAIRLAHATPRVAVVQDHLSVPPGATGDALAAQVRTALGRPNAPTFQSLRVLVKGGYIYLRGAVFTSEAKRQAGDMAAAVPGVTGLTNSITVLPPRMR